MLCGRQFVVFALTNFACALGFTLGAGSQGEKTTASVLQLYRNGAAANVSASILERAFDAAYGRFNQSFDYKTFERHMGVFQRGLERYSASDAYASYALYPDRPHCDKGELGPVVLRAGRVTGMAAFPGGAVKKVFGLGVSKSAFDLAATAKGPAAAGLIAPMALAAQSLSMGAGLVQSAISAVIHTVPPMIPPPAWNNQPLPCAPMVTGHNCFGAVLYPITMADFAIADVTDSMLDGTIDGFPNTYASKVGKTSDEMYKACFSSYMSMQCSSIFPRCTTPQSRDEVMPVGGTVPMCLHLCVIPLVACPGFWIGDVMGSCAVVSVPPMCSQAFFFNLFKLPPQYTSFDEANPFPRDCPKTDLSGMDVLEDPALYDEVAAPPSPILDAAAKLPTRV